METSGPTIAREVVGPLRRVMLGPDRRTSPPRGPFFRYAAPLGLLALIGFGFANASYLQDNRSMHQALPVLLSVGAVLPVAVAVRRPLPAWRIAYPMLFLGVIHAESTESWPWPPVQIIGFLFVLIMVAVTEESGVIAWVTAASLVPPFLFTDRANAYGVAVLLVATALFGDVVARRRQSRRQLAEQTELNELERAKRAVLEERARIAREMHDVVAHHMSMIAVRAETAPYRVGELTEPARAELATIAAAARSALTDMRRLLGVLRAETDETLRTPQPGLAELPALVDTARRAGVPVTLALTGTEGVPEAVGLAAYRIVQEALANAARHAPGGPVRIGGRGSADRLEIEVRNEPPASGPVPGPPGGPGHGLVGMRERVTLLGGTLTAQPDDSGGYVVAAVLPYAAPDDAAGPDGMREANG